MLRIEDTDLERSRAEWIVNILAGLSWLGMDPDEGPYRQSERTDRYAELVEQLWLDGSLYACDCTRDEVLARTRDNPIPGYDGYCRDRGLARGDRTALRFRIPDEGSTVIHDVIRGDVEFPHSAMEDFVCVKSTGQPLFVLANCIDDRDTAISHVIRGEDLLPSTPKGLLIWQALDAHAPVELPIFAHLPMLVNEERKKLSKRRGDRVAVESYRDDGFLADAFRNYLALLGWSPSGDREKVDQETLIGEFRLEDVHHGAAFFDVKKLTHLNGEYIRDLSTAAFIDAALPWLRPAEGGEWSPSEGGPTWPPDRFDLERFAAIAPLVQTRVVVLSEVPAMVDFLFLAEPAFDEASWSRVASDPSSVAILDAAIVAYEVCEWGRDDIEAATRAVVESVGKNLSKGQAPIRVAVTGRSAGPPLFEALELLGRPEVLSRLQVARDRLGAG